MKDYRGTCLTRHYIRADAVESVVEMELRRLAEYLIADENRFAEILARKSNKQAESEKETVQSELRKSEMRTLTKPVLNELIDHINVYRTRGRAKTKPNALSFTTSSSGIWTLIPRSAIRTTPPTSARRSP